jgi:hypothetical protein
MRVDLGGPVKRIDVATLPDVWKQMQTAMAQYAEAKQDATAALERLSPDEKDRLSKGMPGMLTHRAPGLSRFRQQ